MALQDTAAYEELEALLSRLMGDEKEYEEFEKSPETYLADQGFAEATAEDVAACMPEQYRMPETARTAYQAASGASASASASATAHAAAAEINYHHNYYYDESTDVFNNITVGDITAGGDVDLDFDQDLNAATGDGAVAVDDSIVEGGIQTGDGIQVNDSTIEDSNFNTGEVSGVQGDGVQGDITAGGPVTVGDDNQVNDNDTDVDVVLVNDSEDVNIANDDSAVADVEVVDVDLDLDAPARPAVEAPEIVEVAPEPAPEFDPGE